MICTIIPYQKQFLKFHDVEEAIILYADRSVNLITDEVIYFDCSLKWKQIIDEFNNLEGIKVFHLFYEFSYLLYQERLRSAKISSKNQELAYLIRYKSYSQYRLRDFKGAISLHLDHEIEQKEYQKRFDKIQEHLLNGNCYQINLTSKFCYSLHGTADYEELLSRVWGSGKAGAYGSATYFEKSERLLFSNSPECLFQLKQNTEDFTLSSMPIKGTLKFDEKRDDFTHAWAELRASRKDQSELDMITDLVRNDLCQIEKPIARVTHRKMPLIVPGLLHQFSQVEVRLMRKPLLSRSLEALFPGGSITGAPKIRSMEYIHAIEGAQDRGFYCGSSVISAKNFLAASINIRAMDVNFSEAKLEYGAGGGITLQSDRVSEYEEMLGKVKSFSNLLSQVCG